MNNIEKQNLIIEKLLGQILHYYNIDTDELNKMIDQKIKRQLERIKNE